LFRLLDTHYEEFRNVYDERFSKRYGFWRPVTDEVVGKYLLFIHASQKTDVGCSSQEGMGY